MELIKTKSIASVQLAEVQVSADELGVYEAALSYVLEKMSNADVESRFGATRDELEGILEDVREALAACGKLDLIAA